MLTMTLWLGSIERYSADEAHEKKKEFVFNTKIRSKYTPFWPFFEDFYGNFYENYYENS